MNRDGHGESFVAQPGTLHGAKHGEYGGCYETTGEVRTKQSTSRCMCPDEQLHGVSPC
jgi:hypothetical protein